MTGCVFLLRFFSFPPARTERVFCKQKVERSKKGAVGEKRKGEKRSRSRLMRRSEESGGKKEEGVEKFSFLPTFHLLFLGSLSFTLLFHHKNGPSRSSQGAGARRYVDIETPARASENVQRKESEVDCRRRDAIDQKTLLSLFLSLSPVLCCALLSSPARPLSSFMPP